MSLAPVKTQAAPLVNPLPWLQVQGNRIVDENGLPAILRGVTIEDQYHMGWVGLHRFNEADVVELVQNWHVNVIRVPILPDLWQGNPSYTEDILDPIVNWGSTHGVYILLGWHAHGNPITGEVEASSLTGLPPFHGNPFNPNMTLATNFWGSVAERYKNDPWVIYSIFNEPAYITWKEWRPVAEQLVDVVRSHNPRALILVSGVYWAYDLRNIEQDPVRRQNIVYEAHVYPSQRIWVGPWDEYFGYLADYYPVFAGEWGYQPGDPGLNATAESYGKPLLTYMAQKNIAWTAFCWSPYWSAVMLKSYYVPTEFGQLVKDALNAPPATLSVKEAGTYNAAIVNCDVPTNMTADQAYVIHITVLNTGTVIWTAEKGFRLGLAGDAFVTQSSLIALNSGVSVGPGETNTFTLVVSAAPGTHTIGCQMFQDVVGDFGQALSFTIVAV